jgi:hypothetical protein
MTEEIRNPMGRLGAGFKPALKSLSLRKRKEIENLRTAYTLQIPSTISVEIDLTLSGKRNDSSYFSDSILDILCFSLSRTYRKFPKINSTFNDTKSYIEFDQLQIGIAFDDTNNLKVLTLKDSELLSLDQIQEEVIRLLELYSSGQTIPLELFNSTFTVTDLSKAGVTNCVPTLSMGQAGIIAIALSRPGVFIVTCTYDHQILEGKYVADFLNLLKKKIISIYESVSGSVEVLQCSACAKTIFEELEVSSKNRGFIVLRVSSHDEILLCRICFEGY